MDAIAIVGAGMRLPGGVHDLESFAALLLGKVDAVREISLDRWKASAFHDPDIAAPGKSRTTHAALLDRLDLFDAEFFGIAPREAERLDPVHRLILEVGWETAESAGIDPLSLAGSTTGVYMGLGPSDFGRELLGDGPTLDAYTATGSAYGTAVGRLAYFLDLVGPAVAVDTGCSAALIAVHLASQALRLGECDLALAGGSNIILSPELSTVYSKGRMLAPDGRCRTFSADAQGFVRGEGCGMVALRRLADAQARGDRILGVIRGSATNQDGRSAGLTAPRQSSQEAVIAAALKVAGVDPLEIGFIEAHGTGTPLGDPIEVAAIGNALCNGRSTEQPLIIGSVKTNVGHLESGAGIAGLLKLLVAFTQETIPANLHFAEGNPFIDWEGLPIRVPGEAVPWPRDSRPRIAAVSSFGFGGSNAHMILEEAPLLQRRAEAGDGQRLEILPISARSPKALRVLAGRYSTLLETAPLADVCCGAALNRAHFACRFAATATSAEEMRAAIDAFLADEEGRSGGKDASELDPAAAALEHVGRRYREGAAVDWRALHEARRFNPIDLPVYPFDRKRHWPPQLRAFSAARIDLRNADGDNLPPFAETLARAPAARRLDMIADRLRDLFAPVQKWDGPLPSGMAWKEAGIEPMSLELRDRIEGAIGCPVPPMLLTNNRNIGELSRALLDRLAPKGGPRPADRAPPAQAAMGDESIRAKLLNRIAELR